MKWAQTPAGACTSVSPLVSDLQLSVAYYFQLLHCFAKDS